MRPSTPSLSSNKLTCLHWRLGCYQIAYPTPPCFLPHPWRLQNLLTLVLPSEPCNKLQTQWGVGFQPPCISRRVLAFSGRGKKNRRPSELKRPNNSTHPIHVVQPHAPVISAGKPFHVVQLRADHLGRSPTAHPLHVIQLCTDHHGQEALPSAVIGH